MTLDLWLSPAMLDLILARIIDAADVDDAEDVAIRGFLIMVLRERFQVLTVEDERRAAPPASDEPLAAMRKRHQRVPLPAEG